MPGHTLKQLHAKFPFTAQDLRFTVGKNGSIYAFCMKSPKAGQTVTIKSMGKKVLKKMKNVSLLGYNGKLKWKHTTDALEITIAATLPFQTSIVFKIN